MDELDELVGAAVVAQSMCDEGRISEADLPVCGTIFAQPQSDFFHAGAWEICRTWWFWIKEPPVNCIHFTLVRSLRASASEIRTSNASFDPNNDNRQLFAALGLSIVLVKIGQ